MVIFHSYVNVYRRVYNGVRHLLEIIWNILIDNHWDI